MNENNIFDVEENIFDRYIEISGNLFTKDFLRKKEDDINENISIEDGIIDKIIDIYNGLNPTNEINTEDTFIKKILEEILNFSNGSGIENISDRQRDITVSGMRIIPDFVIFNTNENLRDAIGNVDNPELYFRYVLTISESKYWCRDLLLKGIYEKDREYERSIDEYAYKSPYEQINRYLHNSSVRWGILTSGDKWLLVNKEHKRKEISYLKIDLKSIIESLINNRKDSLAILALKLFIYIFSKSSFTNWQQSESTLDKLYSQNEAHQKNVEEQFHVRVYPALLSIINGLIESLKKNGLEINKDIKRIIYEESIIFLYRLIFLLYAEDNDLIVPNIDEFRIKNIISDLNIYRPPIEISKSRNKLIFKFLENNERYRKDQKTRHRILDNLFRAVDRGGELGISVAYNGDLFNKLNYIDNEDFFIGDYYVSCALFLLGYIYEEGDVLSINFSDLDIKQLGSIYEYLLLFTEYRVSEENNFKYPLEYKGKKFSYVIVPEGFTYFEINPERRKSTGTFYTPDNIVRYIVENTVGELLKKCKSIEDVLSLKILDPACGSGHFLIRALEDIANCLIDRYEKFEDKNNYSPPNTYEGALSYWKRLAVERCIYGVDINPMAVELAKLAIWLSTFDKYKALNFLDHHIKCGNSLIGSNINDIVAIEESDKGEDLFNQAVSNRFSEAVKNMHEIIEKETKTVDDVSYKENLYNKVNEKILGPFKDLADVYLSNHFGNENAKKGYYKLRMIIANWTEESTKIGFNIKDLEEEKDKDYFKKAKELSYRDDLKFFHWEFEFPEVYFNNDGYLLKNPGFDAIIGNPPYVDSETMVRYLKEVREYIKRNFKCAKKNWDLYITFWELVIKKTKNYGFSSLITPNKWISIEYGEELRRVINNYIYKIGDFSYFKPFEKVGVNPIVTFINKNNIRYVSIEIFNSNYRVSYTNNPDKELFERFDDWGRLTSKYTDFLIKIEEEYNKLKNICNIEEAFATSEAYKFKKYVKDLDIDDRDFFKFINTGTIDRYIPLWCLEHTRYLGRDFLKPVVNVNDLERNFKRRFDQANSPKIVISGFRHFESFYDETSEFVAGKSTLIIRNVESNYSFEYILGLLNSNFINFYIEESYRPLAMDGGINFNPYIVCNIPIPKLDLNYFNDIDKFNKLNFLVKNLTEIKYKYYLLRKFSDEFFHEGSEESIEAQKILFNHFPNLPEDRLIRQESAINLAEILKTNYENLEEEIDELVYKLYNLTPDEIDIIKDYFK